MIRKSICLKLCLLFALSLLLTSCAYVPGGIAPSNIPINGREYDILGPTHGRESGFFLLGIISPPFGRRGHMKDAILSAKKRKKADALIDITVEHRELWFVLFTIRTTTVYGTAIRFKNGTRTKLENEQKLKQSKESK